MKETNDVDYKEIKNSKLNETIRSNLLRNRTENEFILINKTIEKDNPIRIDKFIFNKNDNKWIDESINCLNKLLNNKVNNIYNKNLHFSDITSKDQLLILYHNNELLCIDSTISAIKSRKTYEKDYFIESKNFINGKNKLFYQIEETNDFVGINKLKQIIHLNISKDFKMINEKILIENFEGYKIGLFKNILFFDSNNEIKVYNLNNNSIVFNNSFIKNKLQFACISDDCEYLATFEESRLLSLFRLSNSKRIAQVPIYSEINSILMSDHYLVMCMQDKRILSYLIVDPDKPEHSNRMNELDSRYLSVFLLKSIKILFFLICTEI